MRATLLVLFALLTVLAACSDETGASATENDGLRETGRVEGDSGLAGDRGGVTDATGDGTADVADESDGSTSDGAADDLLDPSWTQIREIWD